MGWLPGRIAAGLVVAVGSVIVPSEAVVSREVPSAHVIAPCPDPVDPITPASLDEAEALLVGTWVYCGDGWLIPPIERHPNEVGIEFAADGRFYRLYEEDGALISVEGLEQEGRWTLLDNAPYGFQLNANVLGLGTAIAHPEFYGAPSLMRTPHFASTTAAFVAWTGAPPSPGVPAGIGEGTCGLPTDPVELASVADTEERLVGTWVRCGEVSEFSAPRFREVGLEFTADRRVFRLYDDGAGGLIRASGGGEEGTWTVEDTTMMNGPGWYQLNVTLEGAFGGHVLFLQEPVHLRLDRRPGVDFQAWTGAPPVPGDPPQAPAPEPTPEPEPAPQPEPDVEVELPSTGMSTIPIVAALAFLVLGLVLLRVGRRPSAR